MKKFFSIFVAICMFWALAGSALAADGSTNATPCRFINCAGWHWFWQCGNPNTTPNIPDVPNDEPAADDDIDNTADSFAEQVVALVNAERAREGLAPVTLNAEVSAAAQVRAQEAAQSFSHTRPDGSSCFTALKTAGISYRGAAENIAYGQTTAAEVMADWMASSGHRANILNGKYTQIGVGRTEVGGVVYWSQFFIY